MRQLTVRQIDTKLRKLMKEQPTFVYPDDKGERCFYNKGPRSNPQKCPGCIFGQAFQNLGIGAQDLNTYRGDSGIEGVSFEFLPPVQSRPRHWYEIQRAQDEGMPWGELVQFMPKK